jgi:hypothetical protein
VNVSFYDVLGIDPNAADRASAAHTLLSSLLGPTGLLSLTQGINLSDDAAAMIGLLQQGLAFTNVNPGVDAHAAPGGGPAGQVGFAAEMAVVGPLLTAQPFYLRSLPDHGIQLVPTDPLFPAQVFFVSDGRGHELIVDRLPVKILLKSELAQVISGSPTPIGTFDKTKIDSFAYTLGDDINPTEIDCFVRIRLTPENDVILEPSVPISFGPIRWMGLPAKNVYDVQLIPSPNRREYLEWAHNDVGAFVSNPPAAGALAFRSIDVDFAQPPVSDLRARCQQGAVHIDNLELVLEDVAVPVSVPVLPIPSHGTVGFRRKITDRTDIDQAFDLSNAPVQIPIYGSGEQGGNGGSGLSLRVEEFFFRTGDIHAMDPADQPQVQFQAELIFRSSDREKLGPASELGPTMGIDADWTFTAGMVLDIATTPLNFTIADTTIGLVGFKFGVSVGRLGKGMPFKESFELLGDLYLTAKATGADDSKFRLRSLTGKQLSVVLKDLGWKLGHFSLDGLQFPDGMQLIFGKTGNFRIIIEEMGWVEEPNGTPYFSFSGGVAFGFGGGNAVKPNGSAGDDQGSGFGLRVRRLRFRLNDDATQPFLKLDGLFLKLKYGTIDVEGFGYISDYSDSGWAIEEWGFGVKVALSAVAMTFSVAAEFIKGDRKNLTDSTQRFDYFLAAASLGFVPAGPIGLYDIRALVADNMAPNLDATFPDGEGMALLKWHQTHDQALNLPANRTLADWIAKDSAFALGIGCGFSLNGCGSAAHIDLFIFFAKSQADTGMLIVGDLYLLKNPRPIAFVAIEYDIDREKFGVMVGVNIRLADFASGSAPDWLAGIASLSGNLYFGNQPWEFAIGQLADQSTWLTLKLDWDIWITVKFMVGVGVQVVDGGPKGFGFVLTLKAGADWGIGSFVLWGSFGFIIGTWKTGSDSTGAEIWIRLGFKINLFWIFSFGAEIGIKLTYLGKHPWYLALHAEIEIDTPWFLPNVTFTIDKSWQEALPFDTSTITQCLSNASGIDPAAQQSERLLTPGLAGALGDAAFVYTFNQLNGLNGIRIADTHLHEDIPIVSVDSTIAINLAQPSANDSLVATSTYDGTTDTGVQNVQDITVRYGLESIAVRRAPRFGPTAGAWTDFVTDEQTGFSVGGVAPESLTFAWDADSRADGKLAPKRLLVNSSSPYSFATLGAQNDEEAAANDMDFPCCDRKKGRRAFPRPHVLEFSAIPFGARTPRSEQFSGEGGWWTWSLPTTPVVADGAPAYAGAHVARMSPPTSTLLGAVDLLDPAANAQLDLTWDSYPGTLYFEGYDGPDLVSQQSADLRTAGSTTLQLTVAAATSRGITRLIARVETDQRRGSHADGLAIFASTGFVRVPSLALYRMSYISLADVIRYVGGTKRCGNGGKVGPPGSDASGKLAFLPNHDYEIVVTSTIAVGTKDQGPRTLQTAEALYFRTKGLPGLNACPNVGDDIRRHVETTYPARRASPLYRQEPCVLAFENSLSSILPIDRMPGPSDPPEKAQMFPLELNIDRVSSLNGMKRLTVPSYDWILAHRANPYPPIYYVALPAYAKSKVRLARSNDPLVLRHEAVELAVGTCGPPKLEHASQVLLHEPIDENGAPGLWEATTGYRATVRQEGGPFTERSGFDIYDLGAFIRQADGSASATLWSVDADANLVAPSGTGGRHYASCGELNWDHLQVHSRIDLASASAAGIAVGVGDGTPVPHSVVATVEPDGGGHSLVVRIRDASGERELGRASVTINGPFLLSVVAYDDVVRASVGEVSVDGPRSAVREGRVALVAAGQATFAGIAVTALDMYSFDFRTSKYSSFGEHIDSYDGSLPTLAAGALGGTPTPIATVLATHAAELPAVMTSSSDPQERQSLFDTIVSALGIGLRKDATAVTITRLTDGSGTFGLVCQSPEPISVTRDVTVQLTRHIRVWVPGPIPPIGPAGDIVSAEAAAASALAPLASAAMPIGPAPDLGTDDEHTDELSSLTFGAYQVTAPEALDFLAQGDQLARVITGPEGKRIEFYEAPSVGATGSAVGALRETMSYAEAARQPAYSSAARLEPGSIAVVKPGGILGPIAYGHWEDEEIAISAMTLTNGDETKMLLLNSTPLSAGKYTLRLTIDRDRWPISSGSDPDQHYHEERTLPLEW